MDLNLWRRWIIQRRHGAYRQTFTGPQAAVVLADLAAFCRACESTFDPDQRLSDVLIGRREVFLRIAKHLNLSFEEYWDILAGEARHQVAVGNRSKSDD